MAEQMRWPTGLSVDSSTMLPYEKEGKKTTPWWPVARSFGSCPLGEGGQPLCLTLLGT